MTIDEALDAVAAKILQGMAQGATALTKDRDLISPTSSSAAYWDVYGAIDAAVPPALQHEVGLRIRRSISRHTGLSTINEFNDHPEVEPEDVAKLIEFAKHE